MPNTPPIMRAPSSLDAATPPTLFSRVGAIVLVIGTVLAFFISQLIGVYVAGRLLLPAANTLSVGEIFFFGSSNGTVVSISIFIGALLLSALSVLLVRVRGGDVTRYLALKPFSWSVAIALVGIWLLFMIGSEALTYWLDKTPLDFVDPLYQSVSSVWLLIVAMVIIAPLYEELIFRGLLWSAIAEQFSGQQGAARGTMVASVVTSLIFALIHLQYGIYEISTIIVLALIFCYARIKSGSLLLPMLLHILNNGIAMWQYLSQVG